MKLTAFYFVKRLLITYLTWRSTGARLQCGFIFQLSGPRPVSFKLFLVSVLNIRQKDTDCLMSGVTSETKKPPFLAVFYGGFEPLDTS